MYAQIENVACLCERRVRDSCTDGTHAWRGWGRLRRCFVPLRYAPSPVGRSGGVGQKMVQRSGSRSITRGGMRFEYSRSPPFMEGDGDRCWVPKSSSRFLSGAAAVELSISRTDPYSKGSGLWIHRADLTRTHLRPETLCSGALSVTSVGTWAGSARIGGDHQLGSSGCPATSASLCVLRR